MGLRGSNPCARDGNMGLRGSHMGVRDSHTGLRGAHMGLRGGNMGLRRSHMGLRDGNMGLRRRNMGVRGSGTRGVKLYRAARLGAGGFSASALHGVQRAGGGFDPHLHRSAARRVSPLYAPGHTRAGHAPSARRLSAMPNYIPSRDADLDAWANNFKTLIAATPTNYGLTAADGTAISNSFNAWHTAFLNATNPTTRTRATVAAKNDQKRLMLGVLRGYAATIRANAAVTPALKIGLGLHVRDAGPTPVPAPSSYPMVSVAGLGQGLQQLRAADQFAPNRRARPTGTAGLLLFRAIATEPVSEPTQAQFLSFVTRAEFTATFNPADNGKTATYFARWTNAKGEVGPWGPATSMPIAA